MCLQDLWLSQFIKSSTVRESITGSGSSITIPPNPNRWSLTLPGGTGLRVGFLGPDGTVAYIYTATADLVVRPMVLTRMEQGDAVTRQFRINNLNAGTQTISYIETFLTEDLSTIFQRWQQEFPGNLQWPTRKIP